MAQIVTCRKEFVYNFRTKVSFTARLLDILSFQGFCRCLISSISFKTVIYGGIK